MAVNIQIRVKMFIIFPAKVVQELLKKKHEI